MIRIEVPEPLVILAALETQLLRAMWGLAPSPEAESLLAARPLRG